MVHLMFASNCGCDCATTCAKGAATQTTKTVDDTIRYDAKREGASEQTGATQRWQINELIAVKTSAAKKYCLACCNRNGNNRLREY